MLIRRWVEMVLLVYRCLKPIKKIETPIFRREYTQIVKPYIIGLRCAGETAKRLERRCRLVRRSPKKFHETHKSSEKACWCNLIEGVFRFQLKNLLSFVKIVDRAIAMSPTC